MYGNEKRWEFVKDAMRLARPGERMYADPDHGYLVHLYVTNRHNKIELDNGRDLVRDIFVPVNVDEIELYMGMNQYLYKCCLMLDDCQHEVSIDDALKQCNDIEDIQDDDIPRSTSLGLSDRPSYISSNGIAYKRIRLFDPPTETPITTINMCARGWELPVYVGFLVESYMTVIPHNYSKDIENTNYTKLPNGDELEMINGKLYQL